MMLGRCDIAHPSGLTALRVFRLPRGFQVHTLQGIAHLHVVRGGCDIALWSECAC